jgi:hypothetical protein
MKRKLTEEQQRQAAERKARFRGLAKQIADLSDADRAKLATSMVGVVTIEGNGLSLKNCCLLAMQMPSATVVGGFRQWLRAGRAVRKGEHGATIFVPIYTGSGSARRDADADPGESADQDGEPAAGGDTRFITATVFDVSQTEDREDLSQPAEWSPSAAEVRRVHARRLQEENLVTA